MRVVPRNDGPRIAFYRGHVEQWLENAEQIGASSEMVTELQTLTEAAREAYVAQLRAKSAARAATQRLKQAVRKMHSLGSSIILQIRSKAGTTTPNVYPLASLPVPKKRSPIGPPGKPDEVRFTLHQNGWLELRWTCKNPRGSAGTVYKLWRSVGGGPFQYLGGTGKKHFKDKALPTGASVVTYQLRAVRGNKQGPWAQFPLSIGTDGLGPGSGVREPFTFGPPVPQTMAA